LVDKQVLLSSRAPLHSIGLSFLEELIFAGAVPGANVKTLPYLRQLTFSVAVIPGGGVEQSKGILIMQSLPIISMPLEPMISQGPKVCSVVIFLSYVFFGGRYEVCIIKS
jgi:hypothetical protein